MIYLLLAILSSAMVSITMRLSEKHVQNQMMMFMANYAICTILSYLFMDSFTKANLPSMTPITFWLGVISGILYLVSFVYLKVNMKYNGIILSSTFTKLGVLIPTLMAIFIFSEIPSWTQIIGIGLSILAIIMIHFEKDSVSEGQKKCWLIYLLLVSGITDSMANIFEKLGSANQKDMYLMMTFFFAFLLSMILALFEKKKTSTKDVLYGFIIGIPNYFSARFLLLALGSVDAVLAYPTYSVSTMILISLSGLLLFHESISNKKKAALGIIMLAICLMNI